MCCIWWRFIVHYYYDWQLLMNTIVSYHLKWPVSCFKLSIEWTSNLNIPIWIAINGCMICNLYSLYIQKEFIKQKSSLNAIWVHRFYTDFMFTEQIKHLVHLLPFYIGWSTTNDSVILKMNWSIMLVKNNKNTMNLIRIF